MELLEVCKALTWADWSLILGLTICLVWGICVVEDIKRNPDKYTDED